jgi:hypothetical protein
MKSYAAVVDVPLAFEATVNATRAALNEEEVALI